MRRIFILIPCAIFVLLTSVYAEDIYVYQHKNGNLVITNTLIPEEYQSKAQKIGSFKAATPAFQHQQEKIREVKSGKTDDSRKVEKEKKYLAEELKRLKNLASADSSKTRYYKYITDAIENHLQLLDKDPESYFLKQEQFEKEVKKILR